MNCSECKNLYRAFERAWARYLNACSSPYYRLTNEHAAKMLIDVERTKGDLTEHREVCPWATAVGHLRQELARAQWS